jgi:hypothetical protein
MFAAFFCYAALVTCLNKITTGGGSNLFPPEDFVLFSEEEIQERIKGSKIVIISEQAMLNTIYLVKTCMLIMYTRLTMGLRQQKMVKAIAVYVACGWVGTELAFFFACRPFNGYWAVPPPNPQCTTLQKYAITQATFNISSDLLMLAIMLPMLLQASLPLKQKIALVGIFGMGSFVIVASILTKVFNLSDIYSTVYMLWYIREASTAIYVSNLPLIWPLMREWIPCLQHITTGHRPTYSNRKPGDTGRSTENGGFNSISLSQMSRPSRTKMGVETEIEPTESAEKINKPSFQGQGILTETTVEVEFDEGHSSDVEDIDLEKLDPRVSRPDRARYGWEQFPAPAHCRAGSNPAELRDQRRPQQRLSSHDGPPDAQNVVVGQAV